MWKGQRKGQRSKVNVGLYLVAFLISDNHAPELSEAEVGEVGKKTLII